MLGAIFNIFFPQTCFSCKKEVLSDGLCSECWQKLHFLDQPACKRCYFQFDFKIEDNLLCGKCAGKDFYCDTIRSPLRYDVYSKAVILQFKNLNAMHMKNFFGDILSKMAMEVEIDIIVPVPLHFLRWIWRGYNQSAILATEVGKRISKDVANDLLIRNRFTKSQGKFRKAQREKNIQNAFSLNKKYDVLNKNILLIDDVCTTGSTLEECAKVLKKFGAKQVHCLTIAKT